MIKWIIENLGTASTDDVAGCDYAVVDVRDLVDKAGNSEHAILDRVSAVADLLKENRKVVICCDYGISRSNAIAAGAVARYLDVDFGRAVELVLDKTGETAINVDVLSSVRQALRVPEEAALPRRGRIVLITGGSGFVGSALAARLAGHYEVVAPTRDEIDLVEGAAKLDLRVRKEGPEIVVHLANPRQYTTSESLGQSLVMLKNVLDVCSANRLNLLYLSSWAVYSGYNCSHLVAPESLPLRPKGTYGQAKALCEALLNHYRDMHDLRIYLLRVSPVYGIGSDRPKFIYTFFEKALKNEPIFTHRYDNALPAVDLLHVEDLIGAIECVIRAKPNGSLELNIGSGVSHSTSEIARVIKDMCGSRSEIEHHEINDYVANIVMDTTKARQLLRWHPAIDITDGLAGIKDCVVRARIHEGH